jgi:hypothetical protein
MTDDFDQVPRVIKALDMMRRGLASFVIGSAILAVVAYLTGAWK